MTSLRLLRLLLPSKRRDRKAVVQAPAETSQSILDPTPVDDQIWIAAWGGTCQKGQDPSSLVGHVQLAR